MPNPGYYFVNWSDSRTDNPRTDTHVTTDISVTANFVAGPPLQSTATPAGGTYNTAQTVTLTQIGGQPGAVIYYTTDNSDPTASSTLYTNPIAISSNTTLKFATYAGGAWETPVKIEAYTFNANLGGSLPATISASVNAPIPITLTFDNQTGSAITTIKPDCFNTYFEVRDSQGQLLPSLCRIPTAYGIPKDVGTIPTGQSTLACNLDEMFDPSVLSGLSGPYTVQATYSNYIQDPDLVNGTCQDPTNGCTVLWTGAIVVTPATVTLTNTFTLTYTAGIGGSISGNTSQTVSPGANGSTVTALPNTGYHFVGWSDGVLTESRTDSNVMANISVTSNFAIDTYTLTYAAGSGGTISGPTSQTVNYGVDGAAVMAVPDTGYHFVNWSDSSTANPRTDTHVTANISVTAGFVLNTYTITATSGANGTVTPSGATTVSYGGSQSYSITPATGYHVADVLVDGVSVGAVTSYPFTNVTANHTITASFAINTYTLAYIAGTGGAISGSNVPDGQLRRRRLAVTAVPNSGYYFVNWSDDKTDNPRTDTHVMADISVTANFAAGPPLQSTATPAGGTYNTAQTVTLTHISGQPGAVIYFTTDNSNPTLSSTPYTKPIPISTDTTLKFAAYAGGAWEAVRTEVYTFISNTELGGSLPATISASVNGPIPVTVTFNNNTGSDIATIPPDCFNTYFEVKDSQGHLLPSLCRIPTAYGIPNDVGTIPAGQSTLTCNLAEMFDPSIISSLSGTYTVQATYSNYIQDPDLVNGTCHDPDGELYRSMDRGYRRKPRHHNLD